VTGFLFPIHGLTPALRVGMLACVILAVALFAFYKEHLNGLAPTQTEPPFAITQVVVLAIFILIALIAVIKFRPSTTAQV
jgi:hypothetical protein